MERDSEYLRDESGQRGKAKEIFFVKNPSELKEIWKKAESCVTIQGSRTGISGAAVPTLGNILNFSWLSGIPGQGEDEKGKYLDVLPGTTLEEIKGAVPEGYFFPSEPTEESATIGGMYAVNAAGPSAGYYGRTGDCILEADVYFPELGWRRIPRGRYVFDQDGILNLGERILKISGFEQKNTICQLTPEPGMDLLDLLAGSEGVLGIFGRLRLRLLKCPAEKWRLLFFFEEETSGLEFAGQMTAQSSEWRNADLTMADFMNRKSVQIFRKYAKEEPTYASVSDVPADVCAVMLEIISENTEDMEAALEETLSLFEQAGGRDEYSRAGDTPEEFRNLQKFRHGIPECLNREIMNSCVENAVKLSVDVRIDQMPIREFLSKTEQITGGECAVTVHIPEKIYHIDPLFYDENTFGKARNMRQKLWRLAAECNGMLAAENGIGKGKTAQFWQLIPDSQKRVMKQVKDFFDRENILNPGNMIF